MGCAPIGPYCAAAETVTDLHGESGAAGWRGAGVIFIPPSEYSVDPPPKQPGFSPQPFCLRMILSVFLCTFGGAQDSST